MPDININRLEDIANVPESAEVDEVRDIAYILMETQGLLTLRNIQNRSLNMANTVLEMDASIALRKARVDQLQSNIVIAVLLTIGIAAWILL